MKITNEMVERAAKIMRRDSFPARFDPRPWRSVLNKDRWRKLARKVLTAAMKGKANGL